VWNWDVLFFFFVIPGEQNPGVWDSLCLTPHYYACTFLVPNTAATMNLSCWLGVNWIKELRRLKPKPILAGKGRHFWGFQGWSSLVGVAVVEWCCRGITGLSAPTIKLYNIGIYLWGVGMLVTLGYCMGVWHVGSGRRKLDLYHRVHAGLAQHLFSELIRREIDITSGMVNLDWTWHTGPCTWLNDLRKECYYHGPLAMLSLLFLSYRQPPPPTWLGDNSIDLKNLGIGSK